MADRRERTWVYPRSGVTRWSNAWLRRWHHVEHVRGRGMRLRGAISQLVSRAVSPGRETRSRWPLPDVTRVDGGYRSTWTDEGRRLWQRDVAAFLASRHSESREPEAGSAAGKAWAKPKLLAGEREVLGIYASHWLVELHDGSNPATVCSASSVVGDAWCGSCPATTSVTPNGLRSPSLTGISRWPEPHPVATTKQMCRTGLQC